MTSMPRFAFGMVAALLFAIAGAQAQQTSFAPTTHMKPIIVIIAASLLGAAGASAQRTTQSTKDAALEQWAKQQVQNALQRAPPNVLSSMEAVRTEDTAAQIHAAVAGGAFGREAVEKQRPYRPIRVGEFWVVTGSLPPNTVGGTAVSIIRASNGETLRLFHTQ
jgi:hypothetical protein